MANNTNGSLSGLVVLEAESMISDLITGRFAVDFGVTVIKTEHPTFGDHIHRFSPQKDGVGPRHRYPSRNKQSITLSIPTGEDVAIFEDPTSGADPLIKNFWLGTPERWSVGWKHLSEVNGDLMMFRLSGFGRTGPYPKRLRPRMLAEAMSSFAYLNGFPDSPPLPPSTGLTDNIVALLSTFTVMFTPYHHDVYGDSDQYADTGLIGPIFGLFGPQPLHYDQLGAIESRSDNRSTSSASRNVYRTGGNHWVAISTSVQPLAERIFDAIGRPNLKNGPRFETNESRLEHVDEFDAVVQDRMGDHSREKVLDAFKVVDVTLASVYNTENILNDRHYAAREAFLTVDDPDLGEVVIQNAFPKSSEMPRRVDHLRPSLGEHNDAIYRDRLSYDESVLSSLGAEGVI